MPVGNFAHDRETQALLVAVARLGR